MALAIVSAAYLTSILAIVVLSFLYTYILAKRFERYTETKTHSFFIGIICGALGTAFLTMSATIRPEALMPGSKVPFTYMHTIGELLLLMMLIFISRAILRMKLIITGKKVSFPSFSLLFISAFIFALYYTLSLFFYSPLNGFLASLNFVFAINIIALFALSLKEELDISKRIAINSEPYIYALFFFLAYSLFYRVHTFLSKVLPITITPFYAEIVGALNIIFAVMLFITAFVFCFISLKKLRVPDIEMSIGDQKKLLPFLEWVSQLIGESTMTIYKYGMEDYKKIYPEKKGKEQESGKEEEIYNFLVRYFENYIGPISSRIAREVDNKYGIEGEKIEEDKRNN